MITYHNVLVLCRRWPDADYQDYKTQDSRYISVIGGVGWGEERGGGGVTSP